MSCLVLRCPLRFLRESMAPFVTPLYFDLLLSCVGDYVRFYVLFVYLDILGCIIFLLPSIDNIQNKYDIPLTNAG